MTKDQFRERLENLPLGAAALLTRDQFEAVFADSATHEEKRLAAITLAEERSCRLLFRQSRPPFAVFVRRQRLSEVHSSARHSLSA